MLPVMLLTLRASSMNFIRFTDDKLFIVSALIQLGRYEVRCLASQKLNHLTSSVCWRCVLLERVKVELSLQVRERARFWRFLGLQR